ncbi:hypothetical protein PVK06_002737 [Gossypium arboreum]|uniref:Aminotransferase-like plant mobile domain-containing protein n=1 Tax=Gossypium arboreum TaxID=29729 RepID=A0ABR0R4J3_GOSAR|nr:hypothetical protein PVK06_002737 [Gossypium arboreum]
MFGGYKLGLTLISALVGRCKLETYTFHLPCGECTITLEGVALQLVKGLVATTVSASQGGQLIYVPVGDEYWKIGRCEMLRCALVVYTTVQNARIRPSVVTVRVEATNFTAIARPERATQGEESADSAKRQRRLLHQLRRGHNHTMGSSSTSTEDAPSIITQYLDVDLEPRARTDADVCTTTNNDTDADAYATVLDDVDAQHFSDIPKI